MFALVDCNNFYASCERLFNPKLANRPVIVLSNNDGCVIARSEEAKELGIAMTTPAFLVKELISKKKVAVFSSNYTLYGDLSDRVMQTLSSFVPKIEIYSIDEAFLDMSELTNKNLLKLGIEIKTTVLKNIGIPVSVGIAPTKTLAKMANRYAKKAPGSTGVFWASEKELIEEMLAGTSIDDVWGIGRQYALFLRKHGIQTALDLIKAPEEWIRKKMGVGGQRLRNELRGSPCIKNLYEPRSKKNICTSRSFGKMLTEKNEISMAVANYASLCAAKLRRQNSCCQQLQVFLQTNPHNRHDKQYSMSITIQLQTASNTSNDIIKYAIKGLDIIFSPGYRYMKCGVIVTDFVPENTIQSNLFSGTNKKSNTLMKAMDNVNKTFGNEIVRTASQGFDRRYILRAEFLSPCYTTNLQDILKVKI